MSELLDKATAVIQDSRARVNRQYYPEHHVAAPVGWINDPNGVAYYQGAYHVFYQFHPYDSVWGPMHWGHAMSKDLMNWQWQGVALAPDQPYDKDGCFSGSALVHQDKLYLMYTGHLVDAATGEVNQVQNIAYSHDGQHFEKYPLNPVLDGQDLPDGISIHDFRDPKLVQYGEIFYAVVGGRSEQNEGCVLLFESANLLDWQFKSILIQSDPRLGDMVECPDLFSLNGRDYLLFNAMNYTVPETGELITHKVWLAEGRLDIDTGQFQLEELRNVDEGFDFYAPQTTTTPEGNRMMFTWMQAWHRTMPTHELGHLWAGQLAWPRRLTRATNGQLAQAFILPQTQPFVIGQGQEVVSPLTEQYGIYRVNIKGTTSFRLALLNEVGETFEVQYESESGQMVLSRHQLDWQIRDGEGKLRTKRQYQLSQVERESAKELVLILDRSSVEISFGQSFASSTVYPNRPWNRLVIKAAVPFELEKLN